MLLRTDFQEAARHFHADDASSITQLPSRLKSLLPLYSHTYIDLPHISTRSTTTKSILRYLSSSPGSTVYDSIVDNLTNAQRKPLAPEVAKLRAVKSEAEQRVMRAAADISGTALAKVIRSLLFKVPLRPYHLGIDDALHMSWAIRGSPCGSS
jgi:intermediate cleaving peptidase 55